MTEPLTRSKEVRHFTVRGQPAPQGSKVAFVNKHTGRAQMLESSKVGVDAWRSDVRAAATDFLRGQPPMIGPVAVKITFTQARPKGHYGTGRNAGVLKASAPEFPTGRPDIDKLVRSTFDAMTKLMFEDDSKVIVLRAQKLYGEPGAMITISSLALIDTTPTD